VIPPASGGSDLLISRNVPAYDPSGPVPEATDASYDTYWWPDSTPTWLAYDLSSVPPAHRSTVLSVWYNPSFQYDHTLVGDYSYNLPHNYSLEANAAPGGGTPPSSNWVSLLSISGNQYHSRQHVLSLTGYSWLRLRITSADNNSPRLNWDLYDASSIRSDDWIFFGDSITAGSMGQDTVGGVPAFASLINASQPTHFPVEEDGGIGYLTSDDGAQHISTWLALFPGKYVGLSYGTNDANGCVNASSFYQNYVTMVQAVLAAGKIPVIPHLPWGRTSNIQNCGPALNAKIDALYQAFPQIIKGPDLWAYFQAHQSLISSDNIHPTDPGFGAYRQQWANTMLAEVYG
jgi:lysophospholipase L1-like esterase